MCSVNGGVFREFHPHLFQPGTPAGVCPSLEYRRCSVFAEIGNLRFRLQEAAGGDVVTEAADALPQRDPLPLSATGLAEAADNPVLNPQMTHWEQDPEVGPPFPHPPASHSAAPLPRPAAPTRRMPPD